MKFKALIILFLMSMATLKAQEFGVKGGLNIADVSSLSTSQTSTSETSSKFSYHGGIFVLIPVTDFIKFMPQLIYSNQGAKDANFTANYNYLNVPLTLNFYPSEVFFLQAGPQLGVLTGAEITNGTSTVDVKNQLAGMDFSFCFGLGVDLKKIMVSTNYNVGFTSISKARIGDSITNSVFQFSVGYKVFKYEPPRKHKRRKKN